MKDCFFSRKSTLKTILEELVNSFDNKQEHRLWDGTNGPVEEMHLQPTIEQVGLRGGSQVFIEFKLESGEWPSD